MTENKEKNDFKSAFVSITGKANTCKSSLLNKLVERKLSLVSDKPVSTVYPTTGICNKNDSQLIFIDTPPVTSIDSILNKRLNDKAKQAVFDSDIVLFCKNPAEDITENDKLILDDIPGGKIKILLLTKADSVDRDRLASTIKTLTESEYKFDKYLILDECLYEGRTSGSHAVPGDETRPSIPIRDAEIDLCGFEFTNVSELRETIRRLSKSDIKWFDDEQTCDESPEKIYSEFIREQVFNILYEEVPHSVTVSVTDVEETKDTVYIYATLYVERAGQRGILIGKSGSTIKKIRINSQRHIQKEIGKKVRADLTVKVLKNWRKDVKALSRFGL